MSSVAELSEAPEVDAGAPADVQMYAQKARRLSYIPVTLVQRSDAALRDVQRETEEFQNLLHSINRNGVLKPILVREVKDAATGVTHYGLIDGLQRWTCACETGKTEIPAHIVEMDDAEILEVQLVANLNKIETKPAEYAKHLLRMLQRDPFLTRRALAERISVSLGWLDDRLSLGDLHEDIQKLVDANQINLSNAYMLAKIPVEEQPEHVDAAMSESPKSFVPRMKERLKAIKDAKKAGKDASDPNEFKPTQVMQKVGDVKEEYAQDLPTLRTLLVKNELSSTEHLEGAKFARAWILNSDPDSVAKQRDEHAARLAKREEAKEKAKKEKAEKQAQLAAEKAASLT
jgi:ParB/RepB/Spo0J family partition protein